LTAGFLEIILGTLRMVTANARRNAPTTEQETP
jgi:hypothetical protein